MDNTFYKNFMLSIFFAGLFGAVYNQRNFLVTMMSIELIYLGMSGVALWISYYLLDIKGRIVALTLLAVAASESALGLGILVVLFRFTQSIMFKTFEEIKG